MFKKSLLIVLFVSALAACSSPSGIDRFEGMQAKPIFDGGEVAMAKGDYDEAMDHFEAIQAMYPYGHYARQSGLNLIFIYYKENKYDQAITAGDRFIHLFPIDKDVDYAYYMKGVAEYRRTLGFFERYFPLNRAPRDLTSYQMAFDDLSTLLLRFPNSEYAPDARKRLFFMRNMLAEHEMEIATYYYARDAYLAAITRAQYIVTHLQQTPSVIPALELMHKAYTKLGMPAQAQQAMMVLKVNHLDL